jgi:hypothetical protein
MVKEVDIAYVVEHMMVLSEDMASTFAVNVSEKLRKI